MEETKTCSIISHHCSGSIYDKNKVPIKLFEKENSNIMYKSCEDCRAYDKNKIADRKKRHKEQYELSLKNKEFMYCPGRAHLTTSELDRDKVPKISFRQFKDHEDSPLFTYCEDCRIAETSKVSKYNKNKAIESIENGMVRCSQCKYEISTDDLALNRNGEIGTCCKPCKLKEYVREMHMQELSQQIKLEMMEKYESCCYVCNNVFIKNPSNVKIMIEIVTYLINGIRYLEYDNITYQSLDFILSNKNNLMLQVLQFDHLTEIEQRERGMLKDHQPFIPKKFAVLDARNDFLMRKEAAKCQLCCMKCHLLETIRREKKVGVLNKAGRIKLNHINKLKETGCVLCGYQNHTLPRYFHFDHIDVENKIERISQYVEDKYTFQDLLKEIEKCRILCQPCHFIHTQDQLKEGVFNKLALNRKNKTLIS